MKRSLGQLLKTSYPANVTKASVWVLWTIGSLSVSFGISLAVDYIKNHHFDLKTSITHGELFAFSGSLIIGAGRLILKDEELEDFYGRQFIGALALFITFVSEVLFFVWKVEDFPSFPYRLGSTSIIMSVIALLFVAFVVLIDASRIPRANLKLDPTGAATRLQREIEGGL